MAIRMIAGLGNPGSEYQGTRHNIGFDIIDALAVHWGSSWELRKKSKALITKGLYNEQTIVLAKPQTYMNESGYALKSLCSYYKIPPQEVAIIYDDVTLPVGRVKLNNVPGTAGHNGAASVLSHLGSGFLRYRIGVCGSNFAEYDLTSYVLGRFSEAEKVTLSALFPKFIDDLHLLIDKEAMSAMNLINQKVQSNDNSNRTT